MVSAINARLMIAEAARGALSGAPECGSNAVGKSTDLAPRLGGVLEGSFRLATGLRFCGAGAACYPPPSCRGA